MQNPIYKPFKAHYGGRNMKKKLAIILAASMIALSLAGCQLFEPKVVEETTVETEETEETTTAAPETTTEEETTVAETEDLNQLVAERADGSWTIDLMCHISAAEQVLIEASTEQEGVAVKTVSAKKNGKTFSEMNLGKAQIVMISDGTTMYTIDHITKSFCQEASTASAMDETDSDTLGLSEAPTTMLDYGVCSFNGSDYIYEEFESGDLNSDGTAVLIRYFYDDSCNVVGCSITQDGVEQSVLLSVEFDDVPDELFEIPSGYSEITTDEMGMITLSKIMSAMPQDAAQ